MNLKELNWCKKHSWFNSYKEIGTTGIYFIRVNDYAWIKTKSGGAKKGNDLIVFICFQDLMNWLLLTKRA